MYKHIVYVVVRGVFNIYKSNPDPLFKYNAPRSSPWDFVNKIKKKPPLVTQTGRYAVTNNAIEFRYYKYFYIIETKRSTLRPTVVLLFFRNLIYLYVSFVHFRIIRTYVR